MEEHPRHVDSEGPGSPGRHCCFLTLEHRGQFVIDDELAIPALADQGWSVTTVPWRANAMDWSAFDLVIVRSTWDWWHDVSAFLEVLEGIAESTRLANPLSLLRWNLRKTYLRDLEMRGVPVVPTHWLEAPDALSLRAAIDDCGEAGAVVKPQFGANGDGVVQVMPRVGRAAFERLLMDLAGEPCMVQPFRENVVRDGELSLFYFDGACSHAIRKRPAPGEFRSQEERGALIEPLQADEDLQSAGDRVLAALGETPLYARVDLLNRPGGGFELVELELVEPSLYFRTDPGAPRAFARSLERWLARSG